MDSRGGFKAYKVLVKQADHERWIQEVQIKSSLKDILSIEAHSTLKKRIRFENTPRRSPTIHIIVSNVLPVSLSYRFLKDGLTAELF